VVSIAGTTASRPTRGEGPYAAAKAGLVALTKTAAVEYAPEVRVNAVSPGYIATRLTRAVVEDERLRARVEGRIPMGRIGTVDDVAGVVAFLCGPDAAYLTGQDIVVDGGVVPLGKFGWEESLAFRAEIARRVRSQAEPLG